MCTQIKVRSQYNVFILHSIITIYRALTISKGWFFSGQNSELHNFTCIKDGKGRIKKIFRKLLLVSVLKFAWRKSRNAKVVIVVITFSQAKTLRAVVKLAKSITGIGLWKTSGKSSGFWQKQYYIYILLLFKLPLFWLIYITIILDLANHLQERYLHIL